MTPSVCPRCGHAWWKHDATFFSACVGQKDGGGDCGCQMTKEQAEKEATRA